MTPQEAKQILLTAKSNPLGSADPEIEEALSLAEQDAELKEWLGNLHAFHAEMSHAFESLMPPDGLKERILAARQEESRGIKVRFLKAFALAASITLLLTIYWTSNPQNGSGKEFTGFEGFRDRMVRTVIREYRMDIETSNVEDIRTFLTANDFSVEPTLIGKNNPLNLLGAGRLSWNGKPVAMVCYETPQKERLFLFATASQGLEALPAAPTPIAARISRMDTWSWSDGNRIYVLAGEMDSARLRTFVSMAPSLGTP